MYPKPIQKLIDIFSDLPGVGPRQGTRFVFFLLGQDSSVIEAMREALAGLTKITHCDICFRTIERSEGKEHRCAFCRDQKRDHALIAVIEKEADLQSLEQTNAFNGLYHVLDGMISPIDPDSPKRLHLKELHQRVRAILDQKGAAEIILATSSTTEGDTTALYLDRILEPLKEKYPNLRISRLGRGLSLGAELEYADAVTLRNALTNRK